MAHIGGTGGGTGDESGGRERRRHLRVRIRVQARLAAPPRAAESCQIYNMSVGGALIESFQSFFLGQKVVLHLDGFAPIPAHVARVTSTVVALAFEDCDRAALAAFIERHADGLTAPPAACAPGI